MFGAFKTHPETLTSLSVSRGFKQGIILIGKHIYRDVSTLLKLFRLMFGDDQKLGIFSDRGIIQGDISTFVEVQCPVLLFCTAGLGHIPSWADLSLNV